MIERQTLLKEASDRIAAHATNRIEPRLRWRTKAGGAVGNYSPAPWIRLFDARFSPRTTEGFYLCWLFSARGNKVHLSLNQGTSEFRANKWRPISDGRVIEARTASARSHLTAWPHRLVSEGVLSIDLGSDRGDIGREASERIRNYELGHIAGFTYGVGTVPTDHRLVEDLLLLAPLLGELYQQASPTASAAIEPGGPVATPSDASPELTNRRTRYQGRTSDRELNRAIELHAMKAVVSYFEAEDWLWEDVSAHKPYDLQIARDGLEVHVEVKGTTSEGQAVNLTHGEVRHAREFENCILAVVSNIEIHYERAIPVASGGRLAIMNPWRIDDRRLIATNYRYDVRGAPTTSVHAVGTSSPRDGSSGLPDP